MSRRNISIVHWFPELEKHKCGYCKQINTNCSYGMWAESLTVEDYQYLIDRGWRRSGKYCYKPVMDTTCCPLYTIRCEALNFKLTKSQKKIIKRVNRHISEPYSTKPFKDDSVHHEDMVMDAVHHKKEVCSIDIDKIEAEQIDIVINQRNENTLEVEVHEPSVPKPIEQSTTMSISSSSINHEFKPGVGADPTKPPCKKAKLIRLERKQQKMAAKGIPVPARVPNDQYPEKTLEEFVQDISYVAAHRLKVCLVLTGAHNKDWTQVRAQEYEVYRKYQMNVHGDPPDKCTEKKFTSFLLESPLQHAERSGGPPDGYGSFHQQYWLDGNLIAVGVIDILPKCVSSVYFFYDPDYRHLTLGTYGSIRELYFVRELSRIVPEIKYYYMGYYIHTCQKMRYKAKLQPSYLLCPETYYWFPMDHCLKKLEKEKYSRFHDDLDAVDKDGCNTPNDIDQLMILFGYQSCIPYKFLKDKFKDEEDKEDYFRFGKLIGKKLVPRLLVVLRNAEF